MVQDVVPRTPQGCEERLQSGSGWVHLRLCLTCGHVGCCDPSPNRPARWHAGVLTQPIIQSSSRDWRWCNLDERFV